LSVDLERILFVEQIQIEQFVRHMPIVIQTDTNTLLVGTLCPAVAELALDDSCDDNGDDSGSLNHHRYGPKTSLSCLVRVPACSWQCGGRDRNRAGCSHGSGHATPAGSKAPRLRITCCAIRESWILSWGPVGDHTSCAMPNDLRVPERHPYAPAAKNLGGIGKRATATSWGSSGRRFKSFQPDRDSRRVSGYFDRPR
jgi:hypothetical protein